MKAKTGRIVKRVILFSLLVVLMLIVSGAYYINNKKNEISKELLGTVNELLVGSIDVDKVQLGSLWDYPDLDVKLKGVRVFEVDSPKSDEPEVIYVPEIIVETNLEEVFSSRVILNSVTLKGGVLNIYRDSTATPTIGTAFDLVKRDTVRPDSIAFVLEIDTIFAEDLMVHLSDFYLKDTAKVLLNSLHGNLIYKKSRVYGDAVAQGNFTQLNLGSETSLAGSPISFDGDYNVLLREKSVKVNCKTLDLDRAPIKLGLQYDYVKPAKLDLKIRSRSSGIPLSTLIEEVDSIPNEDQIYLKGDAHLDVRLKWKSNPKRNFTQNINGHISLNSKSIHINGADVDRFINKYERSQNFSLIDIGAVMLAGPVGLAVTKGSEFTMLLIPTKGDSTVINEFVSEWGISNGKIKIEDLAMSTTENRVAGIGDYNMLKDSLDFNILIVDKRGCAIANQEVYGPIGELQSSKVKIFKTLFGSLNNLLIDIKLKKCKISYDGKVAHPVKLKN